MSDVDLHTYVAIQDGNQQMETIDQQLLRDGHIICVTKTDDGLQPEVKVRDYFWLSLLACVLCAWPCALLALVFSYEAKTNVDRGNYLKARSRAKWALVLLLLSVLFGIAAHVINFSKIFNFM